MKRTSKSVFFIVLVLILALAYTSFFGVYTQYGDRTDAVIHGAKDIRWGIDIRGGVDVTYGPVDESVEVTEANLQGVETIIAERLVGKGITDYELYSDAANNQVIVRFPWASNEKGFDPTTAIEEIGQTAQLEFRIGDETTTDKDGNTVPAGKLVLTGKDVKTAEAAISTDKNGNQIPVVNLELNESGKQAFADATKQQLNKGTISIWLDGQLISNPTPSEHITDGKASISSDGFQTPADAADLANLINSGSLPFAIEAKSSGTISPTMGEKALEAMVIAGIIAFALIAVFMIVYYRLPGFVAVIALLGQVAGAIAAISGYFGALDGFTLTLPGIAGLVLSIGIGVDANVITAERIREEIRSGKTIDNAIRIGSKNSFWSIFDGNVTVIIVAIVLMGVFGPSDSLFGTILSPILRWFPASTTGSVYSFGYTLLIGTIFNLVMGLGLSRAMIRSISRFKFLRKPWLYGAVKNGVVKERKPFDFAARRKLFMIISAAIIGVSLVFNLIFGTEMDITFKGGTLVRYSYSDTVDADAADAVAKEVLGNNASAKIETVNNTSIISVSLAEEVSTEQLEKLDAAMKKALPDNKVEQFSSNTLQASMGKRFFAKCLVAVGLAAVLLLIYVGWRFRKIGGLSAGLFALLALVHDLLIVYFTFVIFRIPLNDNFVAVMLTILGYSLNDTIVIYDRIRENRRKLDPKTPVFDIVNLSLNQSFVRTRNTSITTGIAVATIAVVALVLRMDAIISFALPMLLGVLSGFYSSVCLSSPLWAGWVGFKEKRAAAKTGKAKK